MRRVPGACLAAGSTSCSVCPALHEKAKMSPSYRFYALYDKVYRADVLSHAYRLSKSHGGVQGVDGQRYEDIEAYGRDRWLADLAED